MFTRPHDRLICLGVLLVALACVHADDNMGSLHWNKAHGLWGKRSLFKNDKYDAQERSPQNSRPYESLWGERYALPPLSSNDWAKRSQWQLANGLWGR
ncbi:unnamed protein product [Cylicocyclus nassatus]|uniref:Uncharacterized protein n=1 Tax=Cylicocyclus nassatus TaxID=53992 RepID=A0AA36GNU7_CYLNA|nr:unnamed protein product [Cylicocyclus nassatus]